MHILVVGATGRTGQLVAAEGRRRGHAITAFTRRPHAIAEPNGLTSVVIGDGRDPRAVRRALQGADAVVAVVAAPGRKGPHHTAEIAHVLTQAMTDLDVHRLVMTGAYPRVADRPRVAMATLRRLFADAYADDAAMEEVVARSALEWTIVRLNRLTDGRPTGLVHTTTDLVARPRPMTRTDTAGALLDILVDPATFQTAINATGARRPATGPRSTSS